MTSEADTRANYIDPALASSGWQSSQIVREYYFTDGRKLAGGQRGTRCFVDYLLRSSNRHLAIIEAKKRSAHPTQGLQQAIAERENIGGYYKEYPPKRTDNIDT
jgi:type I restriction enzyme R subunit